MTAALPVHLATDGEPIPAPNGRIPGDGPDMRAVAPVAEMIDALRQFAEDEIGYIQLWREHIAAIGVTALLHYARDGEQGVILGMPCDSQSRHRNRWAAALCDDLDADARRRPVLMAALERANVFWDERLTNPAATTQAVRDFIRTGGRILVTPQGKVTEGGGLSPALVEGPATDIAEARRASQAYRDVRYRFRADRQIKRAVRLLGHRTPNGWMVLEARA